MPQRLTLTEKRMRDLTPPGTGEVTVYDEEVPSLAVRLRPDGRPRWCLIRKAGGRLHRVSLGAWPDVTVETARDLAREALVKLARGTDPNEEKRHAAAQARGGKIPFQDALDHVLARMAAKGRAADHVRERRWIGESLITAGLRDLADSRAMGIAERWINGRDVSDLTKHRYGQHVRAIGRAALKRYPELTWDPFLSLEVGSKTIPQPAMFALPELIRLASDEAMETEWGRLFGFLFLTGCRLREGAWARWSRLDLDHAAFAVLPPSAATKAEGEAVKRDRGRTVTLQSELVELLRSWPREAAGRDFVFSDEIRLATGKTTPSFRGHLERLGIPVAGRHIHTLRHAHVALSAACGVSSLALRLSVGHGGEQMTSHYANAAMLWRNRLSGWNGVFRLRDPVGVARLAEIGIDPADLVAERRPPELGDGPLLQRQQTPIAGRVSRDQRGRWFRS